MAILMLFNKRAMLTFQVSVTVTLIHCVACLIILSTIAGLAARDPDWAEGTDEGHPIPGLGQSSTKSPDLEK